MRKITDDDVKALWAYLKTVAPIANDVERMPVDLKDNPRSTIARSPSSQSG